MTSMNGAALPRTWPERIRALGRGELTPVTPRAAATVLLLRDDTAHGGAPAGAAGAAGVVSSTGPLGSAGPAEVAGSAGSGPAGSAGPAGTAGSGPDRAAGSAGLVGSAGRAGSGAAGSAGPFVHMLRRRASMAFAGGAYAYPGGGVDPRDERPVGWAGPSLQAWADTLGVPAAHAQAVVCAAVRETFEESGVLLAGPDAGTVVADTTGPDWESDRAALVTHDLAFADFLARRALVLRSDLLAPWARWITPEFEERRYDTWFFLALLPDGQRTRDVSGEADRTVWLRPADAVAGYDRGELTMLPPTVTTLRALLPYDSATAALAAAPGRDLSPVLARAAVDQTGEIVLSWPGHDEFTVVIPAGPDPAGPDLAGSGSAGLDPAGPGSAGPDAAGLDPAGSGSAGLDPAGPDPAGPGEDQDAR